MIRKDSSWPCGALLAKVTDGRYTSMWTFLLDSQRCPRNFLHRPLGKDDEAVVPKALENHKYGKTHGKSKKAVDGLSPKNI